LRSRPSVGFTEDVTQRNLLGIALFAALCLAGLVSPTSAQNRSVFAPPLDLNNPPADAEKSASGLISKVLTPGRGTEHPLITDMVTVEYTGWSSDGTLQDSTASRAKPNMFPLNRTALKGWEECVQLMVIGEKRRCWMPEPLAYNGAAGRPKGQMVFDIELLDTHGNPTAPPAELKAPAADAKRTSTGLAYKVLRPGTGTRHPAGRDKVVVHYTGWTTNGKAFDTSLTRGEPVTLGLDEVIKGWGEGLQLMVEGERTRFWIPQDLAYKGETGSPRGMLIFDVELIRIQ
jgi:FKBP-type peptidyl-prolyl cis-trans isomerase